VAARSDSWSERQLRAASAAKPRAVLREVTPPPAAAGISPELWAGVHLPRCDSPERLTALAACAQQFSPRVSLAPPDGLLLEVRGSLHLFAGVAGLRAALSAECRRRELQPVLAFAPTPLAALAGARAGRPLEVMELSQLVGKLAPLPLSVLRWPEETLGRLKLLGVRTVGAALRLPRAGFARRFGAGQLAMLDQLTGRAPDVRATFQPRARFRRRRELDCELTSHELLRAALAPLFGELGAFLEARQFGVTELECLLMHRQRRTTHCLLRLASPYADAEHLAALLAEQLNAVQLPEAVRACELRAHALEPYQPDSQSLWQPGEQGGGLVRESSGLIERLRARLGPEAIYGLRLREGHRPEHAWAPAAPPAMSCPPSRGARRRCAISATAEATASAAQAQCRPLWLLSAPQPLEVRRGWPWRRGPLRLVSEPERIETGWWDGGEIARDYYTALDMHGVRLWVFRERAAPHGWFLHGVFG
jgi:protein ImuB